MTGSPLGKRLSAARARRRMSQQRLADAAGISVGLIRKLEQGQRRSARLDTMHALAHALDLPVSDLLGVQSGAVGRHDVVSLRAAVHDVSTQAEPPALEVLQGQVRYLRGLYWRAHYNLLAQQLPAGLAAARSAVRAATGAEQRRAANALLAEILKITASLVTHLGYEDLAHVALLQTRDAAEGAEDVLLCAAQRSATIWVLSRQGLWQQAQDLAATAARQIEPVGAEAGPQRIAMWGELLHFGMVALARGGRHDEAQELLGLVQTAGQAVGDRAAAQFAVPFGATFAAHSAVQLYQATDRPRDALRAADRVEDPQHLPPSIHARFLLNKAWALTLEWRSQEALDTLRKIEGLTPELLDHHGLARVIVEELLPRRRKQRLPGLVRLAERLQIPTGG